MAAILIPLPDNDFDPTEAAVPWQALVRAGHQVTFATPEGIPGRADPVMLTGKGLGPLAPLLMADAHGRAAYSAMLASGAFQSPLRYVDIETLRFDALLLPGGHAPGMKPYLESAILQAHVGACFAANTPVAAICHGVLLVARSLRQPDPALPHAQRRSVLFGRKTTALTKTLEYTGWALTALWMGRYYRTYPEALQDEVTAALADPLDFIAGPRAIMRDAPERLTPGFVVLDGNYLSARWPGDAHRFAAQFVALLARQVGGSPALHRA